MVKLLTLSALLATHVAAECTRESLQKHADTYISSLKAGSGLQASTYTEQFKPSSLAKGIHSKPIKVGLTRHLLDTTACATFSEINAPENTPPMVIVTQTRYTDNKVSKMETLYTTKENGWIADPAVFASYAAKESRPMIPEGQRDTRAVIQSIADAYFDRFANQSVPVPHASPCERLEGMMHVAPDCTAGIPKGNMKMTNRRYVIDEAYGTVDAFVNFGGGMPDSHEFRVEGGKLKYVHAVTVAKS
ncbi:hypothetical protein BT63DRAFT_161502 [Microthyrium microscopicum]|uniref:DUF8021 domain-containing protein n=1 Tax=Microthyrium microscopicum TaxID=703497 RepID=A0A6A6UMV7_9PEZI|nr:hypothetical protein BT63DRAFT_161502 [Microthyrium microscopicum]